MDAELFWKLMLTFMTLTILMFLVWYVLNMKIKYFLGFRKRLEDQEKRINKQANYNETVLYGIREQSINLFDQHMEFEKMLQHFSEGLIIGAEFTSLYRLNLLNKKNIENFFIKSFKKDIKRYIFEKNSPKHFKQN